MDFEQYSKAIERTMNKEMTDKEKLSMLAMGWIAEVGEAVDQLKKFLYHGHELDLEEFTKELGDAEWYRVHLMSHFGITEDIIRINNVMKLQKRYPQGFSEEASRQRVDTGE